MNNFLKLLFIIACFAIKTNCISAQENLNDAQVKSMLKDFYTIYITTLSDVDKYNREKIDTIQKKYFSANLLKELSDLFNKGFDYDPLIKAQASNFECLKTLIIKKDLKENDLYNISYIMTYNKCRVTIKLKVIKEKGKYMIDYVFIDDKWKLTPVKDSL